MTTTSPPPTTVLDHLVAHLRSRDQALDGQEPPVAILWPDPKGEWRPILSLLREHVEELLVLGDFRPEERSGPAIWLRCLVDRALGEPALPEERAPILYLPGVARQDLRAGDGCPEALAPLVDLLYRGALWVQPNGNEWGVTTFLTSQRGLGLELTRDRETAEALLRALPEVAEVPVTQLEGRPLRGDDFDRMLTGDVIRDLLRWMSAPEGARERLGENGWGAFCSRCREELGFDPEVDADVEAGHRMVAGLGPWGAVWERFAESPGSFPGIAALLRRSRRAGELELDRERWPEVNEKAEAAVREALRELPQRSHADACDLVARLEREHGERRGWVWARLGLSPLAGALEPLARLAAVARTALGGATPEDAARGYAERGWEADAASWEALAAAPSIVEREVAGAVRHLLGPWLDDSARAFQAAAARAPLPGQGGQPKVTAGRDVCLLFVDGLRYDLGRRLAGRLEGRGCRVEVGHRWAALPTVTATAKPAVTPVADDVAGERLGEDFAATLAATGQRADARNLREAIQGLGYQLVETGGVEAPSSHPAHGWAETGDIDSLGHKLGAGLARQLPDQLERLAERVLALLDAGWEAVEVVTDHGWLLLPGGLPKVDLPRHLTASRWARCAVVAGESRPEVERLPWHWNPSEHFATAPGAACFNRGEEYAHGGVSLQECLTPVLRVERARQAEAGASIRSVTWRGLRCFVEAEVAGGTVTADLRLGRPNGPSVAATPKPLEADGAASLVLPDDEHEGAALVVVLLDEAGRVLAHQATRAPSRH